SRRSSLVICLRERGTGVAPGRRTCGLGRFGVTTPSSFLLGVYPFGRFGGTWAPTPSPAGPVCAAAWPWVVSPAGVSASGAASASPEDLRRKSWGTPQG